MTEPRKGGVKEEMRIKREKLAQLKRDRELRAAALAKGGSGADSGNEILPSTTPTRAERQVEADALLSTLLDHRPRSAAHTAVGSLAQRGSRPSSVFSAGDINNENHDTRIGSPVPDNQSQPRVPQTLTTTFVPTLYEVPPSPIREVFSYSVGVQTSEAWKGTQVGGPVDSEDEQEFGTSSSKRMSRREKEREEELRQNIREEIEEELRLAQNLEDESTRSGVNIANGQNFPARHLTSDELNTVLASDEFMEFVNRSSKVIERALDSEYDILADYGHNNRQGVDDDDGQINTRGKGRRKIREIAQFYDEKWSKKRMISSINFSPKFPELVLASYTKNSSAPHDPDGIVQVWNMQMHDRPEFVFQAQSDVLVAKFSPFHPNLIVGGCYSGQILLWDTRAKSMPVQKTPLTGSGHTHPVYSVDIVGTQNANNIVSCSTDGVVCSWTVDMLALPQESLTLTCPPPAKTEDLSPICMGFPHTDPTYFLVGTEEGTIYPCHRYDRAGARAGVDQRVSYRGHAAPVVSMNFHPARGPIDLGDLILSSSLDWSVKLWKIRAPAATATTGITGEPQTVSPLLDLSRDDVVYDAAWSPVKPSVFSVVDGSGSLEIWDVNCDVEVPILKIQPTPRKDLRLGMAKSLNKVAWEEIEGKRLATGGIDGTVTIFEVGPDLGGKESVRNEEWTAMKKLVAKLEIGVAGADTQLNGLSQ